MSVAMSMHSLGPMEVTGGLVALLVFKTNATNPQTTCATETYDDSTDSACRSLCRTPVEIDANLANVLSAWATLPDAIKAGIMAMVKASAPERRD
jgi:hypothetical protein